MIYHIGSGSGGVEEMVLEMEKSQVMYALGTYVCACVCECVLCGEMRMFRCVELGHEGVREGGGRRDECNYFT